MTSIAPLGWGLVVLSVLELALCYRLPIHLESGESPLEAESAVGESAEGVRHHAAQGFNWHHYLTLKYLKRNLRLLREKASIWQSIIGLAVFWAISQVVLAAFPAFAKATLAETNSVVIQGILAFTGFGIIAGSLLAARLSRNYLETGLIPVSALGITLALALLPIRCANCLTRLLVLWSACCFDNGIKLMFRDLEICRHKRRFYCWATTSVGSIGHWCRSLVHVLYTLSC